MKLIRWAFFTFFVLFVVYPSARALGASPGGSVLGFSSGSSLDGSASHGSLHDASIYHIDEAVRQKGNGVEILKPGGGGRVEGLVGDAGRGLVVRADDDRQSFNISNNLASVSVTFRGYRPNQQLLNESLSNDLGNFLLRYAEQFIGVLKDWFAPQIYLSITHASVGDLSLYWTCKNGLSECFPPSCKDCFGQIETILQEFQKKLRSFSTLVNHHYQVEMNITFTGEIFNGSMKGGDFGGFQFHNLYQNLTQVASDLENSGEEDFQKNSREKIHVIFENNQAQDTLRYQFSEKDEEALRQRLVRSFAESAPRGVPFQPLEPRQSRNKDLLKDHQAQIDLLFEKDGISIDREFLTADPKTGWDEIWRTRLDDEGKERWNETHQNIMGNKTERFMEVIRSQCPYWEDCSSEYLEILEQKHQTRLARCLPLLKHDALSKLSDFEKHINTTIAFLRITALTNRLGYKKKQWQKMTSESASVMIVTLQSFCENKLESGDCSCFAGHCSKNANETWRLANRAYKQYGTADDLIQPNWQSWPDFVNDLESSIKLLNDTASIFPLVEKQAWDEAMETAIFETTQAIGQLCLRLVNCTQKEVEDAVQMTKTELQKAKSFIQLPDLGHLTNRADPWWQNWSDFDKDIEATDKYYHSIAPLWQMGLPGVGKKEWDDQLETLLRQTTDAIGQFCLRLPNCTEKDVEKAVQKAETKLRSLKTLIQSRGFDVLATRELSKDEWTEFHKQTEIFGKTMDDFATKLATLDPPNLPQLGRETFDQQAGNLISSNAENFREKCLEINGCTEHDVITMVQNMKDRIEKSSNLIPWSLSPLMARDLPSEMWAAVDGRIEAFGKSVDNLAHKLASSGAPGARKAFDQTVDEWIRVIAQGTQEQCAAVEGCNDEDLAKITQKMRDRVSKSAAAIHSRDASTDAFVEEFGRNMDNAARAFHQLGWPYSAFADQIVHNAETAARNHCNSQGGCDEQALETTSQKLKDRVQQSAKLFQSRDISISLLSRDLSKENWAEFDQEIDSFGKQLDDQVQNSHEDELPPLKKSLESLAAEMLLDPIGCPENEGCEKTVLETIRQKVVDRIRKSASLIHSRELPTSIFSRELSEELWAVIDHFVDNFGETTDRYAREAQNRAIFNEQVTDWTNYRLTDMEENCPRIEGCDEEVLAIITRKYRERAQQSVNLIHSRELPVSAKRAIPAEQMAANDLRVDGLRKTVENRKIGNSQIHSLYFLRKKLDQAESEIREKCHKTVGCTNRLINTIAKDSLKRCQEQPRDGSEEAFQRFADRYGEEFQNIQHVLAELASSAGEKRSDGLLIPFLDLKGPPSLTEGSIPADKRENPKQISKIMDDDIVATRKILDAVFPVAQEFGAEQTKIVLLWIEKIIIDRMIELCKGEKECTLEGKTFRERYHNLLEEFQNSVQSGEGPHVDKFAGIQNAEVQSSKRDVRDLLQSDIQNSTIEFLYGIPEVVKTLTQLVSELEKSDVVEKQGRFVHKLSEVFQAHDTVQVKQEQELYKVALQIIKNTLESSQLSPSITHRADDTFASMNDFQGLDEMAQGVEHATNQTVTEVDCNIDPTDEDCIPKPDSEAKETHKNDSLASFTDWLPFIALFSIISLLLLLLGLKCCTIWSRNRRSMIVESDESPTPTKATSQPLLGSATRPDDEEAQMSQIREPVAPMGLDGASEGWARKWISSKRGDEVCTNRDSCLGPC